MKMKDVGVLACLAAAIAAPVAAQPSLKEVYQGHFKVGAALNQGHFRETDAAGAALVKQHFNTITAENDLKWERVHPKADAYNFEPADRYVEFGEKNGMFIVGHCLVWHSQTPRWVFEDEQGNPLTRAALLKRMGDLIMTVVGRYKGRINPTSRQDSMAPGGADRRDADRIQDPWHERLRYGA